jgi:hypothetical protein
MGIYPSGIIFGIRIYNFNDDDGFINILFEEKYDEIMSHEQISEAYLFYDKLKDKDNIFFKIYTECSSTYGNVNYMDWITISLNAFIEKFSMLNAFCF